MHPNFKINSQKLISIKVKSLGLADFYAVTEFVRNLPYKRNLHKDDIFCIMKDFGGTCSTKHAFLKNLAQENEFEELKLMLGIFNMNWQNTPKISKVLEKYNLKEIPEAHNYLRFQNEILDFTRKNSTAEDFVDDLIEEIEIQSNQITDFKVKFHQEFLKKYLSKHPQIPFSLEEFWNIREEAILVLQQ